MASRRNQNDRESFDDIWGRVAGVSSGHASSPSMPAADLPQLRRTDYDSILSNAVGIPGNRTTYNKLFQRPNTTPTVPYTTSSFVPSPISTIPSLQNENVQAETVPLDILDPRSTGASNYNALLSGAANISGIAYGNDDSATAQDIRRTAAQNYDSLMRLKDVGAVEKENAEKAEQEQARMLQEYAKMQEMMDAFPSYESSPEEYRKYIGNLPENELISLYTSPGYKLNDADMERATQLYEKLQAEYSEKKRAELERQRNRPQQALVQDVAVPITGQNVIDKDKQDELSVRMGFIASDELKKLEAQKEALNAKLNTGAAAVYGSLDALLNFGFNRPEYLDAARAAGAAQHPLASFLGAAGTQVAKYMSVGGALDTLGIGAGAFGKIGEAGSDAIAKIPGIGQPLTKFFTPQAMASLTRDLALDIGLDTIPRAIIPGIQQLAAGSKTGADGKETPYNLLNFAGDVAGNVALNAGFNVLGEGVQQALGKAVSGAAQRRAIRERDALSETLLDAMADIFPEDALKADVKMDVPEIPRLETAKPNIPEGVAPNARVAQGVELYPPSVPDAFGEGSVGAAKSMYPYETKPSRVVTNTLDNTPWIDDATKQAAGLNAQNPDFQYRVVTEKQSLNESAQRLSADFAGEKSDLMKKAAFDGVDMDTAFGIMQIEKQKALETGDFDEFLKWAKKIREQGTEGGQRIQAFAKYSRTAEGVIVKAEKTIAEAQEMWVKANPDIAHIMEDIIDEIMKLEQFHFPFGKGNEDTLVALKNAVEDIISKSKLNSGNIPSDFSDRIVQAIARGDTSQKKIWDTIEEMLGIPGLSDDDYYKILTIMDKAETLGEFSKERFELEKQAYKIVADKYTSSAMDKWNAWRYMAMLANPRTHINNIGGNTLFGTVSRIKDDVGALIENVADRASRAAGGDGIARTKSVLNPVSETDQLLKSAAKADFNEYYSLVMAGGKYNPSRVIEDQVRVFKNEWLEKISRGNSNILELEDAFFNRVKYADSLARYLKANGADASIFNATDDAAKALLNMARRHAALEAQKATFRDANSLASALSNLSHSGRSSGTLGGKVGHALIEGVVPFKKTPMNIVKRGIEYSPVGLLRGIGNMFTAIKRGNKGVKHLASEAIDQIASGLTGTGIMALGAFMYSQGWLTGGQDDNSRQASYDSMLGSQNYALQIGGKSYTLDWAAPAALPLFVGVEIAKQFENSGEGEYPDLVDALLRITDPVLEMTMLQGVNRALESARYSGTNAISSIASNAATNYVTQAIPTVGGQIARTIDPTRRSTYTNRTGTGGALDRVITRVENRIPFLSMTNEPYVDQWGRTQENAGGNMLGRLAMNTISPGFFDENRATPVDEEIQRLYDSTGESSVIPRLADKTVRVDGQNRRYTKEEYTQYATIRGQTSHSIIESLLPTPGYQGLDDAQKADVVSSVYSLANAVARKEVEPGYSIPSTVAKAYETYMEGIDPAVYFIYRAHADLDGNGSISKDEAQDTLLRMNIPDWQRAYLFQVTNKSWTSNPFS